ncbi:MAG: type II toxin-antitoxin system RelE/ParE family toxin [Xanthobacteraceae bacterium]
MKRTLVVAPEAEAEINQAKEWYLSQSWLAAARFREAVDLAIETIERNPEQYQVVYRQTRRMLVDEFPYALFYTVTETLVTVVSCFHTARDPKLWR